MSRWPTQRAVSAGGVVLRRVGQGMEVLLCGRQEAGIWALPKGAPESGESLEEAARREVAEETGLEVSVEAKVGSINYWFIREGGRYHKTVHFYLMRPVGGSVDRHDPEFDLVRWFPAEEACQVMSYQNEAKMVRRAMAMAGDEGQGAGEQGGPALKGVI